MGPSLPPPDPGESPFAEPAGMRVPVPTTIFARGNPTPEAERLADAVIAARPGLLIVVAPA